MQYEVNLRAALDQPYFVRLARPVLLSCEDRDAIDAAAAGAPESAGWSTFVRALRARAEVSGDLNGGNLDGGDLDGGDLFHWSH